MRHSLIALAIVGFAGLLAIVLFIPDPAVAAAPSSGSAWQPVLHDTTLQAEHFLRHTVNLHTGEYGTTMQGRMVVNHSSDLDYGSYLPDGFSVGVEGGRVGRIIDLGSWQDLAERYGYTETVGGGQGFSSIHIRRGRMVILQSDNDQTYQPLAEGEDLLQDNATALIGKTGSAPVAIGHVYLVRILDRYDRNFERIAKILVVGHVPGQQTSLVWEELGQVREGGFPR